MFTSLNITPDSFEEVPARTSLPWVWFGFLFAAAFVIEETLVIVLELDEMLGMVVMVVIALAGWLYWLFCINRFHKILQEVSRNHYPISPAEAVGKHFIPFYNLVWVFRWPNAMSEYLNRHERVTMVSGNVLGLVLLLSLLTGRFLDAGVGLTGTFAIGMYISAKLRNHIEQIGVSRDKLPPPPDPNWFKTSSTENAPGSL